MRRRLFYIYKYQVGRDRANRDDYVIWLSNVADWFDNYTASLSKKWSELILLQVCQHVLKSLKLLAFV